MAPAKRVAGWGGVSLVGKLPRGRGPNEAKSPGSPVGRTPWQSLPSAFSYITPSPFWPLCAQLLSLAARRGLEGRVLQHPPLSARGLQRLRSQEVCGLGIRPVCSVVGGLYPCIWVGRDVMGGYSRSEEYLTGHLGRDRVLLSLRRTGGVLGEEARYW